MATSEKTAITDKTKLSALTVGELKTIIREVVEDVVTQAVFELEQQLPDLDAGLELKPEFAEELRRYLREKPKGRPAQEVMKDLELLDE